MPQIRPPINSAEIVPDPAKLVDIVLDLVRFLVLGVVGNLHGLRAHVCDGDEGIVVGFAWSNVDGTRDFVAATVGAGGVDAEGAVVLD